MSQHGPGHILGRAWHYQICCAVVCRDGVPCGRPAALWPARGARRRCLSHGGRDGDIKAGRKPLGGGAPGWPELVAAR